MVHRADCDCKFKITETQVFYLVSAPDEPEQWEPIATIPTLEPPETPTGWAKENIIWPHQKECLEAQERWVNEGMKAVRRLIAREVFKQEHSAGLTLFRVVGK